MKSLREQMCKAIRDHQRRDEGLVVNPDALVEKMVIAVDRWLSDLGKPEEWERSDVDKWSRETIFRALREAAKEES